MIRPNDAGLSTAELRTRAAHCERIRDHYIAAAKAAQAEALRQQQLADSLRALAAITQRGSSPPRAAAAARHSPGAVTPSAPGLSYTQKKPQER